MGMYPFLGNMAYWASGSAWVAGVGVGLLGCAVAFKCFTEPSLVVYMPCNSA